MRVVVLGAGLLGVASAYYLQQLGHEVTVVDRHPTPAAKARGRAAPGAPASALASKCAGRRATSSSTAGYWKPLYEHLRRRISRLLDHAVGARPKSDPFERRVRLAAYSRTNVRALHAEAGAAQAAPGTVSLSLYTDAEAFRDRTERAARLHELGCEAQPFSTEEAVRLEPALQSMRAQLAGATLARNDPGRDPSQFATTLVFLCRAAGVRFLMNHRVVSLNHHAGRIDHVELLDADDQSVILRGQAYVLALGASSVGHAEALNIPMPLHFVREYVATMPIEDARLAPQVALRDRQGKLHIARVETPNGEFLRVTGSVRADLDEQCEPDSDRFDAMLRRVELLLPGAADTARARLETTLHAVSANGLPMIGKTRFPNLFFNTAPGAPGWVHACGAGKSLARMLSGLRPELEFTSRRA